MSIYATLWSLKFPKYGDIHTGCEWIEVTAQAVPPHIGSATPELGYENGDPYADFLPPAVVTDEDGQAEFMRAVVLITEETKKGTARNPQEYSNPLMTLDGKQYASMTFDELHDCICNALRGARPRLVIETIGLEGRHSLHFEDGTHKGDTMRQIVMAALAAGIVLALGGTAIADKKEEKHKSKIEMAETAKVTIDQAIRTASENVPGIVIEAELEKKHNTMVWEIEIVTGR